MFNNRSRRVYVRPQNRERPIADSQYLGNYYIKDFKYLSPEALRVNKNLRKNAKASEVKGCRLFAKLWLEQVMKGLKQFLYEGSLHGVKYIFEPSFSRTERITWIIIVVISVAICAVNILQLVCKWTSTPFVNVIDSLPTPVWAIPFPSVVLCPHLHVQMSFANVSKLNELENFFASLVCPQMTVENITRIKRLSPEENILLQNFISKAAPKCTEVVKSCHWRPTENPRWFADECCEKLFKPIYTDYGLCFAFNSLSLNGMTNDTINWQRSFNPHLMPAVMKWNMDNGYPTMFPPKPDQQPYRVMASGEMNGLGLDLYLNTSQHQFGCEGNNVGFNILISAPTDHVYTSTVLRLPMDRMTTVEVSPITYKTDTNLRALSPDLRQCFFQNERKLQYFEFYTDSNCKQEMWIRETKDECGCVMFNWPRLYVAETICSSTTDFRCVMGVKARVEQQMISAYFSNNDEQRHSHAEPSSCYPACNDILYSTQVYYSDLVKRPGKAPIAWGNAKHGEMTQLNIHFYDYMFLGQHRHAQYDDYYFVGAVGGLLSLFLGFSIISVAELVYFVILKPIHTALKEIYCRPKMRHL